MWRVGTVRITLPLPRPFFNFPLSLSLSPLPEHIHICQAAPKIINARCKAEICSIQVGEDLNGYLWGQLGQIGETLPFLGTRGDVPVVTGMAGGDLSHYNKVSYYCFFITGRLTTLISHVHHTSASRVSLSRPLRPPPPYYSNQ